MQKPRKEENNNYHYGYLYSQSRNFLNHSLKQHLKIGWELDKPLHTRWSWKKFGWVLAIRIKRLKSLPKLEDVATEIAMLETSLFNGYQGTEHYHSWAINSKYRNDYGDYAFLAMLKEIKEKCGERPEYTVPKNFVDMEGKIITDSNTYSQHLRTIN